MKLLNRIRTWLLYKLWKPKDKSPEELEFAREKGKILTQQKQWDDQRHVGCSHLKGGNVGNVFGGDFSKFAQGWYNGQNGQYAVIKHQMANGDIYVNCLRCGKKWKKPIRSSFKKEQDYLIALAEYETAVKFPTNNSMSTSIQLRFSDNGEAHRKAIENS
jgi:hypothetical protein